MIEGPRADLGLPLTQVPRFSLFVSETATRGWTCSENQMTCLLLCVTLAQYGRPVQVMSNNYHSHFLVRANYFFVY
jgi:hypothetical protein